MRVPYRVLCPPRGAQLTRVSSDAPIAVGHALAGTIGYLNAAPESASVEIGYAIVLPTYQRTFVSTRAIGLLLQYALELPEDKSQDNDLGGGGGLGLRRVQWQAYANNAASIRAAQRMGLKLEGIHRCVVLICIAISGDLHLTLVCDEN